MERERKYTDTGTLAPEKKDHLSKKIFIVDDDEYYNNILKAYVHKISKELDIPVETANYKDGLGCLEHIDSNPDFVILDFYLDENNDITLTGYDVLEKIKKYNQNIKVIVISQMHEWANFKEEFLESGATDFFKKDDELYKNLKSLLKKSKIGIN